jgi:hypothetical protein
MQLWARGRPAASYRNIADFREQGSPSKPLAGQLLLVAEALVSRHERLVSGELGLPDQLTVLQLAPAEFVHGGDDMPGQQRPQRHGRALVEQDPDSGDFEGPRGVLEHRPHLRKSDSTHLPVALKSEGRSESPLRSLKHPELLQGVNKDSYTSDGENNRPQVHPTAPLQTASDDNPSQ